jgi:predicted amidophosphoribosyltransferase
MGEGLRGSGVLRALGAGLSGLADLALPGECAGCSGCVGAGLGRAGLCAGCAAVLGRGPVPVRPSRGRARLPVVYALGGYREPLSDLIIAQKERGRLDLATPLGSALAGVVVAALADGRADPGRPIAGEDPDPAAGQGFRGGPGAAGGSDGRSIFLVPIPSAKSAERRRGQDPVLRMARVAAARLRRTGVRAEVLRALRHRREVSDQVGLSLAERARNLAGAMAVTAAGQRALAVGPRVVVLLDDVCTSGATLAEGARAVAVVPGFGSSGGRVIAAVLAGPVR